MTGIKFELPRRLAPFLHHPFFRSANSVRSVAKSDSPIRITYKYLLTITLICATLQYDSPPHTFPAHFPPCNPCRISSLRTPVFHRPATTRFQATSTLFKKHGGYTPQKRTPGETLRRANPKMGPLHPFRLSGPAPRLHPIPLHHNHSAPVAPQSLSMYSLLLHFQRARRLGPRFGSALGQG